MSDYEPGLLNYGYENPIQTRRGVEGFEAAFRPGIYTCSPSELMSEIRPIVSDLQIPAKLETFPTRSILAALFPTTPDLELQSVMVSKLN
jgi:hypothetical protein